MVNWTTAVTIGLIASAFIAATFAVSLSNYIREKSRYSLNMAMAWLCAYLWCMIQTISILLLSEMLHKISLFMIAPIGFFLLLTYDYMLRDAVEPVKVTLLGMGTIAMVYSSNDPNSVIPFEYPSGEQGLSWNGTFEIILAILLFSIAITIVSISVRIYHNTPDYLKKPGLIFLIATIITGPTPLLLDVIVRAEELVPGIDFLIVGLGAFISAIILRHRPKLAYVIPFKALRLAVLDTKSGIPLFTHTWRSGKDLIEEGLFSGMMQSVTTIIKESVQCGNIREIVMDRGVLIIHRSEKHDIACVLVSMKASKILRQALDQFATRFYEEFSNDLDNLNFVTKFARSSNLIEECFPFVP